MKYSNSPCRRFSPFLTALLLTCPWTAFAQDPVRSSPHSAGTTAKWSPPLEFLKLLTGQDNAGRSVLDKLEKERKSDLEVIKPLEKEIQLLVVKGHWDFVEKVLDGLKMKYDLIEPSQLGSQDLSKYAVVFINCFGDPSNKAKPATDISSDIRDKVRKYVENGGFLFTSDWAISLTARVFPEYLKEIKPTGKQNETIPTKPLSRYENHPFLKDVFTMFLGKGVGGTEVKLNPYIKKANWMIERASLTFEIVPEAKDKVAILLISDLLKSKYGSELVAVTFGLGEGQDIAKGTGLATGGKAGPKPEAKKEEGATGTGEKKEEKKLNGGVVFHVIGHFYQQGLGNTDNNEVARLYQMIANFIIEAKKAQNGAKK